MQQSTCIPSAARGTMSPISATIATLANTLTAAGTVIKTHHNAIGGTALTLGIALASGAYNSIPQALLTLACFIIAGRSFHAQEEKGGAA